MSLPAISIEAMLCSWSESASSGAKIVLAISSDDLEHFRLMTVKDGKKAGQRLALAVVRIGEGEQAMPMSAPAPAPQPAEPEPPKGAALAKLAGMLCDSKHFCAWLCGTNREVWGVASMRGTYWVTPSEVAAEVVRIICGIKSRAELDHDPEAAEKFHRSIRIPYSKVAPRP